MSTKLGVGVFCAVVAVTGLVGAETATTVRADVVAMESHNGGKGSVITLNVGHADEVEPGNKAFFPDGKGGKVSDFTIERVGLHSSSATTGETQSAVQKIMSSVISLRKCSLAGTKPDLSKPDVATGKSPPAGYIFAKVIIASSEVGSQYGEGLPNGGSGSHGFRFEIDKGFSDGLVPGANTYLLIPGTGAPTPLGKVELRWVSETKAGGWVTNINGDIDAAKSLYRGNRMAIEHAHCHAAK